MSTLIYNANWTKWNVICIGNSMICSDIWHKYHKWYFELLYVISRAVRQVKFETNYFEI